jgi:hypothetical protein
MLRHTYAVCLLSFRVIFVNQKTYAGHIASGRSLSFTFPIISTVHTIREYSQYSLNAVTLFFCFSRGMTVTRLSGLPNSYFFVHLYRERPNTFLYFSLTRRDIMFALCNSVTANFLHYLLSTDCLLPTNARFNHKDDLLCLDLYCCTVHS